jgi:raffinose/stachyose/melibiose transport system permease protein
MRALRRRHLTPLHVLGTLLLTALAFTTLYPLAFLLINSLKTEREYTQSPYDLPSGLNLDNLDAFLFENHGWRNLSNSVLVIGVSVVVVVALATLASYAFTKLPFRGSRQVYGGMVMLVLLPSQVLLIPLFLIFSDLGWIGSYRSLFFAYVALNLPIGIFLLTSTMRSVPDELLEAARIDGAGHMRTLVSIVVPSAKPGIMTFALLAFQGMWNELVLSLLLIPDDQDRLLTPAVALLQGRFSTNEPLLMAGLLVATLPTVLAVAVFSRYLERGLLAGLGK